MSSEPRNVRTAASVTATDARSPDYHVILKEVAA
jgi:hypothetical protein